VKISQSGGRDETAVKGFDGGEPCSAWRRFDVESSGVLGKSECSGVRLRCSFLSKAWGGCGGVGRRSARW
jgi:hypothetical protein